MVREQQVFKISHLKLQCADVFVFFAITAIVKAKNRTPVSPLTETVGKNFAVQTSFVDIEVHVTFSIPVAF